MRVRATRDYTFDVSNRRRYGEAFRVDVIYSNVRPPIAAAIVVDQAGRVLDAEPLVEPGAPPK